MVAELTARIGHQLIQEAIAQNATAYTAGDILFEDTVVQRNSTFYQLTTTIENQTSVTGYRVEIRAAPRATTTPTQSSPERAIDFDTLPATDQQALLAGFLNFPGKLISGRHRAYGRVPESAILLYTDRDRESSVLVP